jgi:serine protease Do
MRTKTPGKKGNYARYLTVATLFTFLLAGWPLSAFAQDKESIAALRQMGKAFASIAEKASPAVVGIKAEKTVTQAYSQFQMPFGSPFGEDFFDFFRRGVPREEPKERKFQRTASGSGFIITADGYVLTNNHMVQDAEKVEVELNDDRKFTAKVVGTDSDSDVAVLKIDAKDLPYLELADSDALEVGEWVLAIGNPLGLSHSVTAGIVSATGRNDIGLNPIENFIQTDAAINFGNSGGPLINLDGKVVGINTAIVGASGNIGIGFAIPINMARNIYEQIRKTGTVERGFLGVYLKDIGEGFAEALGLKGNKGVLVTNVEKDGPAGKAGVKPYDVVLELDGKAAESGAELRNRVAMLKPGTKVQMVIWRDGKKETFEVELGTRPSSAPETGVSQEEELDELGFAVTNLTDELAERYSYEGESGVIVRSVEPGSKAQGVGLVAGLLIKEVNRQAVKNTREFNRAMKEAGKKGSALLMVRRGKYTDMILLPLSEK